MTSKYTYEQLLEKLIRAKINIEQIPRKQCSMSCPAEDMTGHPAACTCGAEKYNRGIDSALDQLKL